MILLGILSFILVLVWDVLSDYRKWVNKIPVKHTYEALIRGLLLIPSFVFLVLPKEQSITLYFTTAALISSVWWELFDGFYNKIRGFKWRFNGSRDPDDSKLDMFLYNIGDTWEGVLKISLIILFLTFYIIL
jgi:hypothetical protein